MRALVQVAKKLSLVHRSRIDIIANILRAAEKGTRKTHIMYKCNLSYRQLHTYLEFLIERKLMKHTRATAEENSSGTYETTSKGKAFIQAYSSIRALISNTGLETGEWNRPAKKRNHTCIWSLFLLARFLTLDFRDFSEKTLKLRRQSYSLTFTVKL